MRIKKPRPLVGEFHSFNKSLISNSNAHCPFIITRILSIFEVIVHPSFMIDFYIIISVKAEKVGELAIFYGLGRDPPLNF